MTAAHRTADLQRRLIQRGINATFEQAGILRRAQITLHTWGEQECGDSNDYNSWAIERDENTGKPYRCVYPHTGPHTCGVRRIAIPDREAGALRRVAGVCKHLGIYYYHQTDPRGCSLYVGSEPLNDQNYSGTGVACCDCM